LRAAVRSSGAYAAAVEGREGWWWLVLIIGTAVLAAGIARFASQIRPRGHPPAWRLPLFARQRLELIIHQSFQFEQILHLHLSISSTLISAF
jgi:hypothetical protein